MFLQAEDGIRDRDVTGVQTCALPIYSVDALPKFASIEENDKLPCPIAKNRVITPRIKIGRASCRERV